MQSLPPPAPRECSRHNPLSSARAREQHRLYCLYERDSYGTAVFVTVLFTRAHPAWGFWMRQVYAETTREAQWSPLRFSASSGGSITDGGTETKAGQGTQGLWIRAARTPVWARVYSRGAREAFVVHIKAAIKGFKRRAAVIRSALCGDDSAKLWQSGGRGRADAGAGRR